MRLEIMLRMALAGDLSAVVAIENRCFEVGDRFSARQLRYLIVRAQGACCLACLGDRVVGYLSLLQRTNASNLRIYSLATDPDCRGRGVGQSLMNAALSYAHTQELSEVTLEVKVTNHAAIDLYTKNGFVTDAILPAYYHDGEDALHMKCLL